MKNTIQLSLLLGFIIVVNSNAQNAKTIMGFHHAASVATDGRFVYVAEIGTALNPNAKDGDGKILKLNQKGQILDSTFVKEKLNAPKGLAIDNGILYLNDLDRLVAIDLKLGTKLYEIDFSKDHLFLNDIAVWDTSILYVSATDKSQLFKVNLNDKSYTEIKINTAIPGINGLYCNKKASLLYVNGSGSDHKPNGVVGCINLKNNTFTKLTHFEASFYGLHIYEDVLYASSRGSFEKKGSLFSIQLYNNRVNVIALPDSIVSPADFIILKDQLIVPDMMDGALHFIKLDTGIKQNP